jgi:hypothetical protein
VKAEIQRAILAIVQVVLYAVGAVVLVMFLFVGVGWFGLYLAWAGIVDAIAHGNMQIGFLIFLSGIPLALVSVGFFVWKTSKLIRLVRK